MYFNVIVMILLAITLKVAFQLFFVIFFTFQMNRSCILLLLIVVAANCRVSNSL